MENPTQGLTQPYTDPRRLGRNNSEISEEDASDVICILHPNSRAAHDAVQATMLAAPQHILQNEDIYEFLNLDEDDLMRNTNVIMDGSSRDIALRFSSNTEDGKTFCFGRNRPKADVYLVKDEGEKCVSNIHFKIFINAMGTLMLEDTSTNGTLVDDQHLKSKTRAGQKAGNAAMRTIQQGSIISLIGTNKAEIKFMVRIPKRGDRLHAYNENLNKHLRANGKSSIPLTLSHSENNWGSHWDGGAKYNVTGLLGKGAFAMVYRLTTKSDGSVYAAKELDKRKFMKNGILDIKFDNEIKIMKGLRHPNIVQYVDYRDHDQWVYIIMEYVSGGELGSFLNKQEKKRLTESFARPMTKQICHALDYLHKRGITHRDIKPDNILIAVHEPLVVKLSDFGLSKCVNDQETFLKTFCGTLLYCAPEVYPDYSVYKQKRRRSEGSRRPSPYNQAVDLWSFGAVLYHALSGKAPYMGKAEDKGALMLRNIMTQDLDLKPLERADVSKLGMDFVSRLLQREPEQRSSDGTCLKHPWIADLVDEIDYMDVEDTVPFVIDKNHLAPVQEVDEESLDEADRTALEAMFNDGSSAENSFSVGHLKPEHQSKRQRLSPQPHKPSPTVTYPRLPMYEPHEDQHRESGRQALFGEITPSLLESSGVFGVGRQAAADVPIIRERVQQISVNDFETFESHSPESSHIHPTTNHLQYPQTLPLPPLGSAPSLMGAEAQIGKLQVGSPEAVSQSEGTSPDTANPATPTTREPTPNPPTGNPSTNDANDVTSKYAADPKSPTFSRTIDFDLLTNEAAFAAESEARNASRARLLAAKASTFSAIQPTTADAHTMAELAKTIDLRTGAEVSGSHSENNVPSGATTRANTMQNTPTRGLSTLEETSFNARNIVTPDGFVKPSPRLGRLITTPDSFTQITIPLTTRITTFGRAGWLTNTWPDPLDTRVAKEAIRLTFHIKGIEARIESGETNWEDFAGLHTTIGTKSSKCIWINDVPLLKETKDGSGAFYGRIYTGDIITVYKSLDKKQKPLRFKVEISLGDSARLRPAAEAGFEVKIERAAHQRAKQEEAEKSGAASMQVLNESDSQSKASARIEAQSA